MVGVAASGVGPKEVDLARLMITDVRIVKLKLRDGDLMTTIDAARALGLSTEMVTVLRRTGKLPAVRTTGRQFIFQTAHVKALIEERRKAPRGTRKPGYITVPPP